MREDVVIVLNEREPLKKQMAGELSEQLGLRALAQHRIRPEGDLAGLIHLRRPKVLVLDYILGDVGTALDLLARFREELADDTKVIVWTDEPSVGAAVTALKLGAFDYIEMLPNRSLEKVLKSIEDAIEAIPDQPREARLIEKVSPTSPVGDSAPFKRCLHSIEHQGLISDPIAVFYGQKGSGRSRLAEYLHACRPKGGTYISLDFDLYAGSLEQIVGSETNRRIVPWCSNGATVFIDHVEFDTGELLEAVEQQFKQLRLQHPAPKLIIGTSSQQVAVSWSRIFDCAVCEIPPLAERAEDLLPLLTFFTGRLPGAAKGARMECSPALIHKLAQLSWPGNVRQLRAAALEAAGTVLNGPADTNSAAAALGLDRNAAAILDSILESKERWEKFEKQQHTPLNPFLVRKALCAADGNLRIAAARLGTGIPQLRRILTEGSSETETEGQ